MEDRYFKRPNGDVIKLQSDISANTLKSWEDRFVECNAEGKEIKKETKVSKPKAKKKAKVNNGE